MHWFLKYLAALTWGFMGDFLIQFLAQFYTFRPSDLPIQVLEFCGFTMFFTLGWSIISVGIAMTNRSVYYEQTMKFQRLYPQGRIATANYDGAEQL